MNVFRLLESLSNAKRHFLRWRLRFRILSPCQPSVQTACTWIYSVVSLLSLSLIEFHGFGHKIFFTFSLSDSGQLVPGQRHSFRISRSTAISNFLLFFSFCFFSSSLLSNPILTFQTSIFKETSMLDRKESQSSSEMEKARHVEGEKGGMDIVGQNDRVVMNEKDPNQVAVDAFVVDENDGE